MKCKRCGRYNDPSEYPEGVEFDPEFCIICLRNTEHDAEDTPEETDDDPDGVIAAEEAEDAEKDLEEEDNENIE